MQPCVSGEEYLCWEGAFDEIDRVAGLVWFPAFWRPVFFALESIERVVIFEGDNMLIDCIEVAVTSN